MNREAENIVDEKVVEEKLEPTMGLDYLVEVTDKDGKVLQRFSGPSHSFVRQWYDLMSGFADNVSRIIKDSDGINRNSAPHAYGWRALAPAAAGYGHRVGKGTTPVTISDYALETPLEEGTGLDQFEHQAGTWLKPAVVGSTSSWWIRRSMLNSSGATITGIREIGIYFLTTGVAYFFLGVRDVLPSAVYVPNGGAITVTYTFKVTV